PRVIDPVGYENRQRVPPYARTARRDRYAVLRVRATILQNDIGSLRIRAGHSHDISLRPSIVEELKHRVAQVGIRQKTAVLVLILSKVENFGRLIDRAFFSHSNEPGYGSAD